MKAEVKGVPEKVLLKSRNIGQVDLIWPRTGVAKKSGAREFVFRKGVCDFTDEPWTKRVVFREEVEGRCGLAVSVTEPVSVQKVRRFLRLTAKYALTSRQVREVREVPFLDLLCALSVLCVRLTSRHCNWLWTDRGTDRGGTLPSLQNQRGFWRFFRPA